METIVRFADLRCKDATVEVLKQVAESGQFIGGPEVVSFEDEWARRCGGKYCVGTASGTAALAVALLAIKKPGHKYVLVPMLSFAATAFAVMQAGLTPVYCAVDNTGLINQTICWELIQRYRDELAAVVPVHLYGRVRHIEHRILENATVIEDACQAHGVHKLQGKAACYSFYPSKNLGAFGDAGAVVTNDPGLTIVLRRMISYGDNPDERYVHRQVGYNMRMDAIQAAVLNHKMQMGQPYIHRRKAIAMSYMESSIHSYAYAIGAHSHHLYPILVDKPDEFIAKMKNEYGVEVGRHYPYVLQDLPSNTKTAIAAGNPYDARNIAEHVVTLPIGPHMDSVHVDHVINAVYCLAGRSGDMWRLT